MVNRRMINEWKLGRKLLVTWIIASVVPIMFLSAYMTHDREQYLLSEVNSMSESYLAQISERTHLILNTYIELFNQVASDREIIDRLGVLKYESIEQRSAKSTEQVEIIRRFELLGRADVKLRAIALILDDGTAVKYDYSSASSVNTIWNGHDDLRVMEEYVNAQDSTEAVITPAANFFFISRKLENGSTLIMAVPVTVFSDICEVQRDPGTGKAYGFTYIVNNKGTIIYFPLKTYIGTSLSLDNGMDDFLKRADVFPTRGLILQHNTNSKTGWSFYYAYDRNYIAGPIERNTWIYVIYIALISLASLTIVYFFGIRGLIRNVTDIAERTKNSEIRALEAQINPHFVYNTLDTINWMAIDHGEYDISDMLNSMGIIMRYSTADSNGYVTVSEIMNWMEKYVSLQQARFSDSFKFSMDVDDCVFNKRIHKLLIQPFVENAIIHGFEKESIHNELKVSMKQGEHNLLSVIISDNGKGMPEEIVAEYNDRQRAIENDGRKIGLHNIFLRMKLYYDKEASWNIESRLGNGTQISLLIPYEVEDNEDTDS